eukprot:54283-Prymnesium_polylepis.1
MRASFAASSASRGELLSSIAESLRRKLASAPRLDPSLNRGFKAASLLKLDRTWRLQATTGDGSLYERHM